MPGWHAATTQLEAEGKVRTIGILQEQHPDRARLFMQWKGMDWPLFVDSLNLLRMAVVPLTVFVDQHGIVRQIGPDPSDLGAFIEAKYEAPAQPPANNYRARAQLAGALRGFDVRVPSGLKGRAAAEQAKVWRAYAMPLLLWGGPEKLDTAVSGYEKAIELEPEDGITLFQLGVAYRLRYDSPGRRPSDFQDAIDHWTRSLAADPNQYIWRRRIQQYGPRLAKPYPFYDWVDRARDEVRARGETPVELTIEPGGAEIAQPARNFEAAGVGAEPDPEGRIHRDERGFVAVEKVVVPGVVDAGAPARLHLVFRPNDAIQAHWNNEADDLAVWVDPPDGWAVDQPLLTVANPPELVSQEARTVELEVRGPQSASGTVTIPAYALYYVCEDVKGTCLYRRQDIELEVEVASSRG